MSPQLAAADATRRRGSDRDAAGIFRSAGRKTKKASFRRPWSQVCPAENVISAIHGPPKR